MSFASFILITLHQTISVAGWKARWNVVTLAVKDLNKVEVGDSVLRLFPFLHNYPLENSSHGSSLIWLLNSSFNSRKVTFITVHCLIVWIQNVICFSWRELGWCDKLRKKLRYQWLFFQVKLEISSVYPYQSLDGCLVHILYLQYVIIRDTMLHHWDILR